MPRKSKSLNKGSDAELRAYLFHDSGQKLFGGTSGEQDLWDSSDVQQNQEFSIDSEEFPSLPQSEASPGIGNRNAVQGLAVPQNLGNATSGSNQATNSGSGNPSVQGQNQPSSSVLQQGSSSGEPILQSHVPIVNSPISKGWFYDKSSNTIFPGSLDDYFPSADPPNEFLRLQEQQDSLQRESSSSHQQGQQQVPAVSTGGTSSSVNTKGAGGSIPGVLQASASSGYRNVVQGLGVSENAGPQITSCVTGGNISRSISLDVQEQNQLASGVLQQGPSAGGPISQSQVQAVNSPNPNDSFLPNLSDDVTSTSSPERVRRHQEQPGNTSDSTNSRGKEKVLENTMPTMLPQHTTMSRTAGFSSGESSLFHRQQTNAVSAIRPNDEQPQNRLLGHNLSDPLQRESCSSHQQGQQQVPAVSTGGTSSSVNSQDLLQNTNGAGGSIPRVLSASSGSGSSAGAPISQCQFQALHSPNSMRMQNDQQNQQDETLPGFTDNHTNSPAKEKLQEDTMPTLPRQHIPPMSRTVGFGLGESSSPFRQQIKAVSPSLLQRRLASYAEAELYNRGWVYHKGLESWLLKDPNVPLSEQTQTHEKGSYTCFDAVSMTSIRMEDFVVEYKMLKERPALPRH